MIEEQTTQPSQPIDTQASIDGGTQTHTDPGPGDHDRKLSDLAAENKKYRQSYGKYKTELESTQAQLRDLQEQGLREQGKYKDLYDKSAGDLATERQQRLSDRAQWTGHVVASRFAAEAVKLGCQDPMALVKIANADGLLSGDDLVSDESFDVNADALASIVEKARTENPILFSKPTPRVKDGVPANPNVKPRPIDLSKKSIEELTEMAKRL